MKINLNNFGTSNDIAMKLRPIIKLDKRNKITSKKFDDDLMSENCDVIVIFPIYGYIGAICKPDSGDVIYKTYIFITFYLNFNFFILQKPKTELKNL